MNPLAVGRQKGRRPRPHKKTYDRKADSAAGHLHFSWRSGARRKHAGSGKNFSARERTLAAPLIIFAQFGLVFFHLPYQLADGFLATGSHSGARAGGVQRCGGQR